jgi:protein-S-isoprenylcysteine O-methyltransferase Ste14
MIERSNKKMNAIKKVAVAATGLVLVAPAAFAQAVGPDMTSLTSNVSWGTVVTGILAVGAAGVLVILAAKGVQKIYHVIKNA